MGRFDTSYDVIQTSYSVPAGKIRSDTLDAVSGKFKGAYLQIVTKNGNAYSFFYDSEDCDCMMDSG
jgi:hypothetical protein